MNIRILRGVEPCEDVDVLSAFLDAQTDFELKLVERDDDVEFAGDFRVCTQVTNT